MHNCPHDAMLIYENGNTQLLSKLNLHVVDAFVDEPKVRDDELQIKGMYGVQLINRAYTKRPYYLKFTFDSYDIQNLYEKRREIRAFFARLGVFRIISTLEPAISYRVQYRNMEMKREGYGDLSPVITVEFDNIDGFGESTFTSLDVKEWDSNKFAWGMGMEWDDDYNYTFKEKKFHFKNIGTMEINPAQHDIKWRIKCDPRYLKITNFTTNDSLTIYNPSAVSQGIIVIKGLHIEDEYSRNLVRHADAGEIHLVPGINQIKIESSTFHWCEIDTKFYYL
ncbi:phage tail domain-containing protein [Bacillus sp. WLY-B-L8]|uniref:phage tail domain-containing protein n=1 Tax=Bacillus multifaciens TaxID=3068506 RepID=UPI002741ED7E|nr:phage tail domain-containing protein [Bacillus sp. WLY-B-L8]MDP7981040.1 phage tail family protein [Bacillus sp. WLY-B-L8]